MNGSHAYDESDEEYEAPARTKPRSTVRVLGSLLAVLAVAVVASVTCLRAYIGSVPQHTLEVPRTELATGMPRFFPVTSFGSAGTQTHGVWLTLQDDGTAIALASREPRHGCFAAFRPDQSVRGERGVYTCAGAAYARDGTPLSGEPPRGLDRFDARVGPTTVTVELERMLLGACATAGGAAADCSRPGTPVYRAVPR